MIIVDIPTPHDCDNCPFSYMIRSGKNEGRTMCTAMESRAFARMIRDPKITYNPEGFMVDNHYTDRPCGCPIIAELEVEECTE